MIGLSGLVCGLSGFYFLFEPVLAPVRSEGWIFTRFVWDMIHTWSGVAVTAAAILHFAIHWRWVTKVLNKYWNAFLGQVFPGCNPSQSEAVRLSVEKNS